MVICLQDVHKIYKVGSQEVRALNGVNLEVASNEYVAVMGASGSGKSTLMNILGCLDHPTAGEYWLDGSEISHYSAKERAKLRNRMIGFVFQNFNLLPRTSALENVMMPMTYSHKEFSEKHMRQWATELLDRVGLADRIHHQPSQLSGGQQQRVAIARSLVSSPVILLADEPTGNLDSHTSEDTLRMFQKLNESEVLTIILVTHDPGVAQHAKRVIRIQDGLIKDGAFAGKGVAAPQSAGGAK